MEENGILGGLRPGVKIILLAGLCLLGLLIAIILGGIISIPFILGEGADTSKLTSNLNLMRTLQLLTHIFLFLVPAIVFAFLMSRKPAIYLEADRFPSLKNIGISLLVMILAYPMVLYAAEINMKLLLPESLKGFENWIKETEESAKNMVEMLLGVKTLGALAFNIFLVAIVPGVGEELIFRGIILKLFRQWTGRVHIAVWISAIIFSAIHFQFLGFLPRVVLGLIMGYLFVYGRNIWLPIIAHFFNNSMAVVAFYLAHNNYLDIDVDNVEMGTIGPFVALASLSLTMLAFFYFRKKNLQPYKQAES
jgi:membrane protease YdiL (CAAX protease family)